MYWILTYSISEAAYVLNVSYDTHCTMLFNILNNFNICILTLLLHMYDITSHCCICLLNTSLRMAEKRSNTQEVYTCLYITVYDYNAVVGIYRAYTKEWCGFNINFYWNRTILLCMPCIWWPVLLHGAWIIVNFTTSVHFVQGVTADKMSRVVCTLLVTNTSVLSQKPKVKCCMLH